MGELHPGDFSVSSSEVFSEITGIVFHLIVMDGSMEITIDNKVYECSREKNNMVSFNMMHVLSKVVLSDDFYGYIVALSRQFMEKMNVGKRPISIYEVLAMRDHPVATLPNVALDHLGKVANINVWERWGPEDDMLDAAIFSSSVHLFHLMMVKYMKASIPDMVTIKDAKLSRASTLFEKFMMLVAQYADEHHDVAFYADKLCVTPHYLTMVCNEHAGTTASKVIAMEIMTKAVFLLRVQEYTLQEISDKLHFSDQSSFGKFFRKHNGKTPATYRKEAL